MQDPSSHGLPALLPGQQSFACALEQVFKQRIICELIWIYSQIAVSGERRQGCQGGHIPAGIWRGRLLL